MDSQSVRIAEESGGNKGYDAAKCVPGRKRHLLVDTSGLLLADRVTPANISDNGGARELLAGLAPDASSGADLGRQRLRGRSCGAGAPNTPAGNLRSYRVTATALRSRLFQGGG
jgi:hypothetical protein